jgi:hypothetical protein
MSAVAWRCELACSTLAQRVQHVIWTRLVLPTMHELVMLLYRMRMCTSLRTTPAPRTRFTCGRRGKHIWCVALACTNHASPVIMNDCSYHDGQGRLCFSVLCMHGHKQSRCGMLNGLWRSPI